MSKPYNPFRAASLSNALRLVSLICLSAIILMAILYFSIKDNRQDFISWLGFKKVNLEQTNMVEEKDNLGLSDTTVVNNSLRVRELDRSDNLWGEIDAPVNLIVYVDFECPFCAQFNEVINQAKAEFGSKLVVAIRHFPLISHPQAMSSALAAECAAEQNKFWEMYQALFSLSQSGKLNEVEIKTQANKLGLDEKNFSDCLTKEKYKDKIVSQKDEVKTLGVNGTPASFINNQVLSGAVPYEDFTYPDNTTGKGLKTLIEEKLAEVKK